MQFWPSIRQNRIYWSLWNFTNWHFSKIVVSALQICSNVIAPCMCWQLSVIGGGWSDTTLLPATQLQRLPESSLPGPAHSWVVPAVQACTCAVWPWPSRPVFLSSLYLLLQGHAYFICWSLPQIKQRFTKGLLALPFSLSESVFDPLNLSLALNGNSSANKCLAKYGGNEDTIIYNQFKQLFITASYFTTANIKFHQWHQMRRKLVKSFIFYIFFIFFILCFYFFLVFFSFSFYCVPCVRFHNKYILLSHTIVLNLSKYTEADKHISCSKYFLIAS